MNELQNTLIQLNNEDSLEGKIKIVRRTIDQGNRQEYLLVCLGDLYCQRAAQYLEKEMRWSEKEEEGKGKDNKKDKRNIPPSRTLGTILRQFRGPEAEKLPGSPRLTLSQPKSGIESLSEALQYLEEIKPEIKTKLEMDRVCSYLSKINLVMGLLVEDDEERIKYLSKSADGAAQEWLAFLFAKKKDWERAGYSAINYLSVSEGHPYYYTAIAQAINQSEKALRIKGTDKDRLFNELKRVFESVIDNPGSEKAKKINPIHKARIYDYYLGIAEISEPVLDLGQHILSELNEMIEKQGIRQRNPKAHNGLIDKLRKEISGGYIVLAKKNAEERMMLLEKARSIDPSNISPNLLMAKAYDSEGNKEEAFKCYKKVLEINPEYPVANLYVGRFSFKLEEYETASLHFGLFFSFSSEALMSENDKWVQGVAPDYCAYLYSRYKTGWTEEPINPDRQELLDQRYQNIPLCDLMNKLIAGKCDGANLSSKRRREEYFGFDPMDLTRKNIIVKKIQEELISR